jgi:hypothetical protein
MQRRAALIGLLTIVALLGGCGGDNDEPTTLPSVSEPATSPATTPTPSATATTPAPGASTSGTIDGDEAIALARKYYETITLVAHEGRGHNRFDALTHPSCVPCKEQADRLRMLTQDGQRVVGGDVQVVETNVDSLMGGTALIRVATQSDPSRVVDSSGSTVDTLPAGPLSDQVLTIAVTDQGVRVVDILALGKR